MRNCRNKLKISTSIFLIVFIITSYPLSTTNIKAVVNENSKTNIDSCEHILWSWGDTEVISTESIDGSSVPSLAVDSLGNVHVAWEDDTDYAGAGIDKDIFYKRWEVASSSWTTTEVVSTESTDISSKPSLAVDSLGNVHIAWEDITDYTGAETDKDIFYKHWNSSISSWTTTEVIFTESKGNSWFPSLAIDILGNVHIAWDDLTNYDGAGGDADIFYTRWNITTSTWWTRPEVVSTESTLLSTRPSLNIDPLGNVHIAWNDQTDYDGAGIDQDIFYKRWDSSISSWTTTEVISTESTDSSWYPSLVVDSLGNVHIAWHDETVYENCGTDRDIFYKQWNSSISSWTTTEVISTVSMSDSLAPRLAIDPVGNVHIAWWDFTNILGAGIDIDIFYKHWDTCASLWTATEVISTESTAISYSPAIAIGYAGDIHIVWYDYTDYSSCGTDTDIFYKLYAGPPTAPDLAPILPNPTDSAEIYLEWNEVQGALAYYIYRSTSNIVSVEGLSPIGSTTAHFYNDTLLTEGTFYYVIVANNIYGNSKPSNCWSIVYVPELNESGTISSLILTSLTFLIVIMITSKRKSKKN